MSVGSGFIAARTTTGSPFVTPPSIPPARFVARRRSGSISSCASEPRTRARANPSPISTPLTAWIPISAAASRASSRSGLSAYEPSPGGTPSAVTSTTPPSVSRSARAASVARSKPSLLVSPPISSDSTGDGDADLGEERLRHGPGGDVDGRLARARSLQRVARVLVPELERPGEVGVPGARKRDRQRCLCRWARPPAARGSSPTPSSRGRGSGRRARAVCPSVAPWRRPARTSTSSPSSFCLGLRPYPWRRRSQVLVDRGAVETQAGRKAGDDGDERRPVRLARSDERRASRG